MKKPESAYDAFCSDWFKAEKQYMYDFSDMVQYEVFKYLTELNWEKPWKDPKIVDQLDSLHEKFGTKVIEVIEKVSAKNFFFGMD